MVSYDFNRLDDNGLEWRINKEQLDKKAIGVLGKEQLNNKKEYFQELMFGYVGAILSDFKNQGLKVKNGDQSTERRIYHINSNGANYEAIIDCAISKDKTEYVLTAYFDYKEEKSQIGDELEETAIKGQKNLRKKLIEGLEDSFRWSIESLQLEQDLRSNQNN